MKKKKFAVEKAVDILVNHTTPFRAFLPSTVICFIQILNNRSIPLHRYSPTINLDSLSISLSEKVIFGGERHHNTTFFNPFSLSTSLHSSTRWCRELFGCHCERGLKPQTRLVTEKNANPKPEQQPHKTHTTIRSIIFMF